MPHAGLQRKLIMKKKLFFILAISIIIGLVLLFVIFGMIQNQNTMTSLANSLFQVRAYDDLEATAKNNKVSIEQINMSFMVENVTTFGETMTFSYLFDQNGYLSELTAYCDFYTDDQEAFETKTSNLLNGFAELFHATASQYYVYSSTDVYDCKDEQSLESVFAGNATIELRVRDQDSSYWVMKIVKTGSGAFLCTIEHYIDDPRFTDLPANIDLTQSK